MLIKLSAAALVGIDAVPVTIEVHSMSGYDFTLVGLPDNAVKEAHERINAALMVNGYGTLKRTITINMSPADIRKEGTAFDLPLAIGMLAGCEQVKTTLLDKLMIMGELSLDGSLQPIHGALPIALCARREGFQGLIVPEANVHEAAVVEGLQVYGMNTLLDVIRFLNGEQQVAPMHVDMEHLFAAGNQYGENIPDFADVRGQENVRRAMEVAAAGGHNMLMVGPPGAGKSMMAKRLPSILPPLTLEEALETTKIHSVAGLMKSVLTTHNETLIVQRPFRAPHHTITDVALIGGGSNPHPGEISLAHNGVLFMDELPEFKKNTLEVLRQPLEDRHITVARSKLAIDYPASFMLVAAMNPCPCGHYGDPTHTCTCTPTQVHKYKDKISGPLLDRIDIQCEIQAVPYSKLKELDAGESSAAIRERVIRARKIQEERFSSYNGQNAPSTNAVHCNAQMTPKMVRQYCQIDAEGDKLLSFAMEKMGLSARAYDRILKVARTIADLDNSENILAQHLMEAISYRQLDKQSWGD
ncbi:MAG: YifB family Mg chelatase-like AAA ATPase [Paludibacteraceae bacterium]|nr:YifB family Mg chelatase-like AAA ATPase [Paludibacteraceae bacterium]